MKQYICVGPTDPDYNDEHHIHDMWHEHYSDRADAFWVWQSFRLCRRTPRKVILTHTRIMALAGTWAEDRFALSRDPFFWSAIRGVRLVRQWANTA